MTSDLHSIHRSVRAKTLATSDCLRICISKLEFTARFETEAAPRTCTAFQELLPFNMKIIHCRWSGEAGWVPLGRWDAPWHDGLSP